MQQYYYHAHSDESITITAETFFKRTGCSSSQTSAHYDDEYANEDYNEEDYDEEIEETYGYAIKYADHDFFNIYEELNERFGAYEASSSRWVADDIDGFLKFLQEHPNFHTNDEFSEAVS